MAATSDSSTFVPARTGISPTRIFHHKYTGDDGVCRAITVVYIVDHDNKFVRYGASVFRKENGSTDILVKSAHTRTATARLHKCPKTFGFTDTTTSMAILHKQLFAALPRRSSGGIHDIVVCKGPRIKAGDDANAGDV
jgi:hypothetical protein